MSISKDTLKYVLQEQRADFLAAERGTRRTQVAALELHRGSPQVVFVTGLRRCGKSTLMAQFCDKIGEATYYYTNFEDDRLSTFSATDFQVLHEVLIELYGRRTIFVFDEVQLIEGWEMFVRRLSDSGHKFYITGSNATLLSKEFGTKLTGRNSVVELFPFSFSEYLDTKQITLADQNDTITRALRSRHFMDYLRCGGIPLAIHYPGLRILQSLFKDVLHRDIVVRYKLPSEKAILDLAVYFYNNPATLQSYSKLKQLIQIKNASTIKDYCTHLENSWLCSVVPLYALSIKRQQLAPKKICLIDTGVIYELATSPETKLGRIFENLAFLILRRSRQQLFYYMTKSDKEVDFYDPQSNTFFQVSIYLSDPQTYQREFSALQEALDEVPGSIGVVITLEDRQTVRMGRHEIEVLPAYAIP